MTNNTKGLIALIALFISALIVAVCFTLVMFVPPSELHLIRLSLLFMVSLAVMTTIGMQGVDSLLEVQANTVSGNCVENPTPAPNTPPPSQHDDYSDHEKELMSCGSCFGFRTKRGQWLPYPGKRK